jgi:hypothetical protein
MVKRSSCRRPVSSARSIAVCISGKASARALCCDLDSRHFAEHGPEQRELLAVVELGLYPLRVRKTSD